MAKKKHEKPDNIKCWQANTKFIWKKTTQNLFPMTEIMTTIN